MRTRATSPPRPAPPAEPRATVELVRHLHPRVERRGTGAGVQLPRLPARRARGVRAVPGGRGVGDPARAARRRVHRRQHQRPGLQWLLADIEAGKIDCVVYTGGTTIWCQPWRLPFGKWNEGRRPVALDRLDAFGDVPAVRRGLPRRELRVSFRRVFRGGCGPRVSRERRASSRTFTLGYDSSARSSRRRAALPATDDF
jgi:hypothetical protein